LWQLQAGMKLSKADIDLRLRESSRDHCINWRVAPLRSGDNVQYKDKLEKKVFVGQIIDIRDMVEIMDLERSLVSTRAKCPRSRMVLIRKRCKMEGRSVRKPDPVEYSNVSDCVKELMHMNEVEWIPAVFIMGPCFIFHIDDIQKGLVGCKGMDKVYFVRFFKSRNGKLIPISPKESTSFYRNHRYPYVESYPERIWTTLITVKSEVQKSLCRGGKWNGRTISVKLSGIPSSFNGYLKEELTNMIEDPLLEDNIRTCR
jgi:hypothetical protein